MSFELRAKIGLDQSDYMAGLRQAEMAAHRFGESVGEHVGEKLGELKGQFAALFGAEAIKEGIEKLIEMGHHIEVISERSGVSIHDVQALGYAAEQTGASVEDITHAFKRLAVARAEALKNPNGEKMDAFKRFGVGIQDLREKGQVELFSQITQKVKSMGEASEYTAELMALMGKNADTLIPAMNAGIDEMIKKFDELNLAIDDHTVKSLAHAKKAWEEFKLEMAKEAAPGVAEGLNAATFMGRAYRGFSKMGDAMEAKDHKGVMNAFWEMVGEEVKDILHEHPIFSPGTGLKTPPAQPEPEHLHDFTPAKLKARDERFIGNETFDSLARIGGFGAQSDSMRTYALGQSILQAVQKVASALNGDFGAETGGSLL